MASAVLSVFLLALLGCGGVFLFFQDERDPLTGEYTGRTWGGIKIILGKSGSCPDIAALWETREVDPFVYQEDPSGGHTYTARAIMPSGGHAIFTGALVRDHTIQVSPLRPGHVALVFRPTDPTALQAFLNQYWSTASAFEVETSISLIDVSSGQVQATPIDIQVAGHEGSQYLGSVIWIPPSFKDGPLYQEP